MKSNRHTKKRKIRKKKNKPPIQNVQTVGDLVNAGRRIAFGKSEPKSHTKMDNLSLQMCKLFPDMRYRKDILNHVSEKKSFQSLIDEQFRIQEAIMKSRKKGFKKVNAESDSDEELKEKLKNAVKQYKSNKRRENCERNVSMGDATLMSNTKQSSKPSKAEGRLAQPKENAERSRNLKPVENLTLGKSEKNVNSEIESNAHAISDLKELINYFFLKETNEVENNEIKKYKEYEKKGAIPKRFIRENLNEKSSRDSTEVERSKSKGILKERGNENAQNGVSFNRNSSKSKTHLHKTDISGKGSDEGIIKLCERTCSKPFFYVVPDNPSPNFIFPRGSYYVVPKPPDSSTGLSIIVHPETKSQYKVNVNENFEIMSSNSNGPNIPSMNDLGKEVAQKSDSHLNIGPEDVKLNYLCKNLEGNNETKKNYDKTPESPSTRVEDAAAPPEENGEFGNVCESVQETEDEAISGAWGVTSEVIESEIYMSELPFYSDVMEKNQHGLISNSFAPNDSNPYLEEDDSESSTASSRLQKKIEDQFSRMLRALPESNIQELRDICELCQGDEEEMNKYIKEVKQKEKTRQHVLDMQFILPDADPEYLQKKVEDLGGNDDAINDLTLRLLENKEYPKISISHVNAERQRLWRIYVDDFNLSDYIRNVPNPKNFEVRDKIENSEELDLVFLKSRYPDLSTDFLKLKLNAFNRNITKLCASSTLSHREPIRLANSTFKNADFDEAFLKEACYIDNKKEIDEYLANLYTHKEMEEEDARLNNTFLCCPLCCNDELITSEAVTCADGDIFCKDCIKRYVFVKLADGFYEFSCPEESCEAFITFSTLAKLLPDAVLSSIFRKQQAAEITTAAVDGLESCPFCEYVYIPNPEDKIFKCQNVLCSIESCRKCREVNHIPLHCEEVERSQDVEARKKVEESMTEKLVRTCPTCFKKFVKVDGCNKMSCPCGTIVCYYCRRKINDYSHFEPSGKCPLYSNNEELHTVQVVQAGVETRNQILTENPDIRIFYDPTKGV